MSLIKRTIMPLTGQLTIKAKVIKVNGYKVLVPDYGHNATTDKLRAIHQSIANCLPTVTARSWVKCISERGVECKKCGGHIRKNRIYFKHYASKTRDNRDNTAFGKVSKKRIFLPSFNVCLGCWFKEIEPETLELKNALKKRTKYIRAMRKQVLKHEKMDEVLCDGCEYRHRHLSNGCDPAKKCEHKAIKVKKCEKLLLQ